MMNIPTLKEMVEERKDKAIENLSISYAKNRLPLEEYERLVEYINKIESERELVVVEKIVAEYSGNGVSGGMSDKSPGKPGDYDGDDEPSHYHQGNSGLNNLAVLSSRTISGPVKSGSQFVSILGSTQIRIRKEDLAKRQTFLSVAAILGDCTISVESGIRVVNKAIPILGSADISHKVKKQAGENAPEIVISGAALLGNISVKPLKDGLADILTGIFKDQ